MYIAQILRETCTWPSSRHCIAVEEERLSFILLQVLSDCGITVPLQPLDPKNVVISAYKLFEKVG